MNETEISETKPGLLEKIGEALSNVLKNSDFLKEIMPALLVCIPPPYDLVALVALPILSEVFKDEKPDHLGYQMNISDKSPDNEEFHGSFKEFKDYLDKNFPFDQTAFNQLTPDQRQTCGYVGMAGMLSALKDTVSLEALGAVARGGKVLGWDNQTVEAFSRGLVNNPNFKDSMVSLSDAVSGKLAPGKFDAVMDFIDVGMKEAGSDKGADDFIEAARLKV